MRKVIKRGIDVLLGTDKSFLLNETLRVKGINALTKIETRAAKQISATNFWSIEYKIEDFEGKIVNIGFVPQEKSELNLSTLKEGMYLLTISVLSRTQTYMITKIEL